MNGAQAKGTRRAPAPLLSPLEALLNHLAMPVRLPQQQDANIPALETALLDRLVAAAKSMRDLHNNPSRGQWDSVARSLAASGHVAPCGRLDRSILRRELRHVCLGFDFLILNIRGQNAGIFIYPSDRRDAVIFEIFEASPKSESVLAADDVLTWDFPGAAISLPVSRLLDDSFLDSLVEFLEMASSAEPTKDLAASAVKAGSSLVEIRDTPDPSLCSSLLAALLEANGQRFAAPVLRKRVRDDVCWSTGRPWRRLPLWLILRVCLRRILSLRLTNERAGRIEYKFFIALVLSNLLQDVARSSSPDRVFHVKAKLSMRLVKLDTDLKHSQGVETALFEYLFAQLEPIFQCSVRLATDHIENSWAAIKLERTKFIPDVPRRASDLDVKIELPNSGQYLHGAMQRWRQACEGLRRAPPRPSFDQKIHPNDFPAPYFLLASLERKVHNVCQSIPNVSDHVMAERSIEAFGEMVMQYISQLGSHYDGFIEQKSIAILTVMEIWTHLDFVACSRFPILRDFHPLFIPSSLDILYLPKFTDMQRLQRIQIYLRERAEGCSAALLTIFNDPQPDCFARRYFDEAPDSSRMKELLQQIQESAARDRDLKEQEWERQSRDYARLSKLATEGACMMTDGNELDCFGHIIPPKHHPACPRCGARVAMERMRIEIVEDPLPTDEVMQKVAIFELGMFSGARSFETYRDVTWHILSRLASNSKEEGVPPRVDVRSYRQLEPFASHRRCDIVLGSTTKSFLETHYRRTSFPVALTDLLQPNGLRFGYFSQSSKSWPGRSRLVRCQSFAHHCTLPLPKSSPFYAVAQTFPVDKPGPSSYDVMASSLSCPAGINIHEYQAFQTLLSGGASRWIRLLSELGASNLNFSSDATLILVRNVALQAGPMDDPGDPLRLVHGILREPSFGRKLLEQLSQRLAALSANWREVFVMDSIIMLALRVCELTQDSNNNVHPDALALLATAREITLGWMTLLRDECRRQIDADTARRTQRYAVWSALLCRKTFSMVHDDGKTALDTKSLSTWVESSISLQHSLLGNMASLPSLLKEAVVADFKLAFRLKRLVRRSIEGSPGAFMAALSPFWPPAEDSEPTLLDDKEATPGWISFDVAIATPEDDRKLRQIVSYHTTQGLFLVNNVPIGKLPPEHQKSPLLIGLLGDQSFLTFPSHLPDASYLLSIEPNGHELHVGFRDTGIFVRARKDGRLLELIPKDTFGTLSYFDLPGPLIADCFHWLDLSNGILEIRPASQRWHAKPTNWHLDIRHGHCSRQLPIPFARRQPLISEGKFCPLYTKHHLVSPHARLFHRVARIFEGLEPRHQIVVWQPQDRGLEVELRRVQLRFHVNAARRLQCQTMNAEIDPRQDIGCWYGLHSKLVLRSLRSSQRTVLVPLGTILAERDGLHVSLRVHDPTAAVGKFVVNEMLGRIESAPEPTLILKKAQLHAMTSFVIPDTLTGRTGTEEALITLASGIAQPWVPLGPPHLRLLKSLVSLSPRREFYPDQSLKVLKKEHWSNEFTPTIQHEDFMRVIDGIISRSERLRQFSLSTITTAGTSEDGEEDKALQELREEIHKAQSNWHLNFRASLRRHQFHRHLPIPGLTQKSGQGKEYIPRDRASSTNMRYSNVLEVASLIRAWPTRMRTPKNLARMLSGPSIKGFDSPFDSVLLSDRIGMDIVKNWGPLVAFARTNADNKSKLMFCLAGAAFRVDSEVDLVRVILAFSIYDEIRSLQPPQHPEFPFFQPGRIPTLCSLQSLIRPFATPVSKDTASDDLRQFLSAKEIRKIRDAEAKHEKQALADCDLAAESLLSQWPCAEPTFEGLAEGLLVDLGRALEAVRPSWATMFANLSLYNHLMRVEELLQHRQIEDRFTLPPPLPSGRIWALRIACEIPTLADLMRRPFQKLRGQENQSTSSANGVLTKGQAFWGKEQNHQFVFNHPTSGHVLRVGVPTNTRNKRTRDDLQGAARAGWASRTVRELQDIVRFSMESCPDSLVRQQYGRELLESIECLMARRAIDSAPSFPESPRQRDTTSLVDEMRQAFEAIVSSMELWDDWLGQRRIMWLKRGLLWPIVTPTTVLQQIGSINKDPFGSGMKEAIVRYGLAMTALQRQQRLNALAPRPSPRMAWAKPNYHQDLAYQTELSNEGHTTWNPMEYPDWLLLEIESDILLRPDQVDVALATISPRTGENSVLQLNMGRGKTSCIIPMVASILANCSLTRVIVPKALLQQTAQLLQARLGGLLNRELAYIPFSRRTRTDEANIKAYASLHRDVMKKAGVVICLPEHLLSFMLSGLQRIIDNRVNEGSVMVRTQSWLSSVCRDIMDESDYTLSVRTQLIFPSGTQVALDGQHHRWTTTEKVLQLVKLHLHSLRTSFPHSIEVVERPGDGYPFVYFLRRDVEDELTRRLTVDICSGKGGILPVTGLNRTDRLFIKEFISSVKVRETAVKHIRNFCSDKVHIRQTVWLLRGLLVNRILLSCLKKKWNVQYGLHPKRDPIAVPYSGKGVPSEQSEWGHPDVAVCLTALAFYYNGLTQAQLSQALGHVLKSDDPSAEYDRWIQSTLNFPDSLREWSSINVDDDAQIEAVWQACRYSIVVIDFFLNVVVFPAHAKQFRTKLQSNGWDLPLFATSIDTPAGKAQPPGMARTLTTGFSGTNDNRSMLPYTITQQDLPGLQHTNAEVLTYLLSPRNRHYEVIQDHQGRRLSEQQFLELLTNKRIHILIDAGAQILEMDNITVARRWLELMPDAPAALFFDEANRPWMLSRLGTKTPLLASAYAEDLTMCLVYLDEAHTRGTDLKLPPMAKAALTLGLGQSKDQTVQAAMRMRQLGQTQAVVFFAPPEVHSSILDLQRKPPSAKLESSDVISWLLANTCDGLEQLQPLYYAQGMNFCRRVNAAVSNPDFLTNQQQRERYVSCIRQDEAQTLQDLYEPTYKGKPAGLKDVKEPSIASFAKRLNAQRKTFQDTGNAVHASVLQEVEQEREVAYEVESVRQVKKPVHLTPLLFPGLHRDLESFARTGRLSADSTSCRRYLAYISDTTLGRRAGVSQKASDARLFISTEFQRSVKQQHAGYHRDGLIRPVNWILWSRGTETAIVINPEEAELLLPVVREPSSPTHILVYHAPITRKMLHFNRLDYYAVPDLPADWKAPTWLKVELGIFAGRLYFEWDEYNALCELIGIDPSASGEGWDEEDDLGEDTGSMPQLDGTSTVPVETNGRCLSTKAIARRSKFANKPLTFLQDWLALRRYGQDFVHTPMGHVTQGKPLDERHPFFRKEDAEEATAARLQKTFAPITRRATEADNTEEGFDGEIQDVMYEAEDDYGEPDEIQYDSDETYSDDTDSAGWEDGDKQGIDADLG